MKNSKFINYLAGFLSAFLLFTICTPTFAANLQKQLAVTYRDIKLYVDGNEVVPKDASGNAVEPFISGGTTYLPVRAVGEALGKEVAWDSATNSVYIGQKPDDSSDVMAVGTVIFEKEGVKVTYAGVAPKDSIIGGYDVKLLIENTGTKNRMVQARDVSVNGFMTSHIFSCNVTAGNKANDQIALYKSELEKNNITTINEVECSFIVYDADDWTDYFETEIFTIKVK